MSQPSVARTLSGFTFTWADLPVSVQVSRIRESSRGTVAEFIVRYQSGGKTAKTLAHQSVNLLTSKARLCKELMGRYEAPWDSLLEQVSILTLRALRQGEPIESLTPTEQDHPAWFVLNPLLYHLNPTILYGPGDSLKSFFALYCGLLLANGAQGPNLRCSPEPRRVLFLDWEMSVEDIRGRVKLLQAGTPTLTETPDYRRCTRPLADEADELRQVLTDGGYDVLILDSLAMAAGGQELERADAAIRFNAALRGLHRTSLIIGHTPKPQEDQKERSLYGSVFFHNLCRVSWECRREGETVALYQKKNNLGPRHDALGFRLTISLDHCGIEAADILDDPALIQGLSLPDQITATLRQHGPLLTKTLCELLDAKPDSIRRSLRRYEGKRWSSSGVGKESEWILK